MPDITHTFEEVPLCIGRDAAGNRLVIALISGTAEISHPHRSEDFDIESVTLSAPIVGLPDVRVPWVKDTPANAAARQLWNWITASILEACTDRIWEEIDEANQPNPDDHRDAMLWA